MLQSGIEILDVHNMTRVQASVAIDSKLKHANASCYRIRIVHGYHSGTVLRDLVRKEYARHPKVKRIEIGLNQGETDLVLKELI